MAIMTVKEDAPSDFVKLKPIPHETWVDVELMAFIYNEKKSWLDKKTQQPVFKNNWKFVVVDPQEYSGRIIFMDTVVDMGPNPLNLPYQWSLILLGMESFPIGFQLDTDLLIGKRARVLVSERWYKDKDGNDKWSNEILEMKPSSFAGAVPQVMSRAQAATIPATSGMQSSFVDNDDPF